MPTKTPKAAPYIVAAVAIAATIWGVFGSPHNERPVTEFARTTIRP